MSALKFVREYDVQLTATEARSDVQFSRYLNERSAEGWKLVQYVATTTPTFCIFVRETVQETVQETFPPSAPRTEER